MTLSFTNSGYAVKTCVLLELQFVEWSIGFGVPNSEICIHGQGSYIEFGAWASDLGAFGQGHLGFNRQPFVV